MRPYRKIKMKFKINEIQKNEGIIFYDFKSLLGKAEIKFDFLNGKHNWYPEFENLNDYLIADSFNVYGFINIKKYLKF